MVLKRPTSVVLGTAALSAIVFLVYGEPALATDTLPPYQRKVETQTLCPDVTGNGTAAASPAPSADTATGVVSVAASATETLAAGSVPYGPNPCGSYIIP